MPFDGCGTTSQGIIGYHMQQGLARVLCARGPDRQVATVVTQVVADRNAPHVPRPRQAHWPLLYLGGGTADPVPLPRSGVQGGRGPGLAAGRTPAPARGDRGAGRGKMHGGARLHHHRRGGRAASPWCGTGAGRPGRRAVITSLEKAVWLVVHGRIPEQKGRL